MNSHNSYDRVQSPVPYTCHINIYIRDDNILCEFVIQAASMSSSNRLRVQKITQNFHNPACKQMTLQKTL